MNMTTALREGFIGAQFKRINRNLLLAPIMLLALTLGALVLSESTIRNRLAGPVTMDRAALLALDSPNIERNYVTVQGDENADTGIRHTVSRNNGPAETDAVYRVLRFGERLLVVKLLPDDANLKSPTLTGLLSTPDPSEQGEVMERLQTRTPGLKSYFLPFMLDATDAFAFESNRVIGIVGVLAILALFAAFQWLRHIVWPGSHPLVAALRRIGNPDVVAAQINADAPSKVNGYVFLGQGWVGCNTTYGVQVDALRNGVWVYPKKVTRRTYGIAIAARFSVLVNMRDGRTLDLPFGANKKGETAANAFIAQLHQRAPWCITGYSAELQHLWSKERAELVSLVDKGLARV